MLVFGDPIQISRPRVEKTVGVTSQVTVYDKVISSELLESVMRGYLTVGAPTTVTRTVTTYVCKPQRIVLDRATLEAYVKAWIANKLRMSWAAIQARLNRGEKIFVTQAEYNECREWVKNAIAAALTPSGCTNTRVFYDNTLLKSCRITCQWPKT